MVEAAVMETEQVEEKTNHFSVVSMDTFWGNVSRLKIHCNGGGRYSGGRHGSKGRGVRGVFYKSGEDDYYACECTNGGQWS